MIFSLFGIQVIIVSILKIICILYNIMKSILINLIFLNLNFDYDTVQFSKKKKLFSLKINKKNVYNTKHKWFE